MATGTLNGLNTEKSRALRDKTVILYPDAGCLEKWRKKMNQIKNDINCQILISKLIETTATPTQLDSGYDLADYILEQFISNGAETPKTF